MVRLAGRLLVAATLLASCQPVCACLSLPPTVVLVGQVQNADSTPAANAVSWAVVYLDTTCSQQAQGGSTTPLDSTAHFRHEVNGIISRQCMAVYAAPPGTSQRKDSVGVSRVHTFNSTYPPDTLVMPVIRLP